MRDEIDIPIDADARAKLNRAGGVTLSNRQVKDLKCEIENYALERESELAIRSTPDLKKHKHKQKKTIRSLVECFRDLDRKHSGLNEPINEERALHDEILLSDAGVEHFHRDLLLLNSWLKGTGRRAQGGRPPYIWLGCFLNSLAKLYLECGGRTASIGPKSAFIKFVWAVNDLLPAHVRHHSKLTFSREWEKQKTHMMRGPRQRSGG